MELVELRHLAEELKETPYIKSDVTHVFSLHDKQLLSLRYSKDIARYQVTRIDKGMISNFEKADQAAEAIKELLELLNGPSPQNVPTTK